MARGRHKTWRGAFALACLFVAGCRAPQADPLPAHEIASLGAMLFDDPALSSDAHTRCASCHSPDAAFASSDARAVGVMGNVGTRNAPSLLDIGLMTSFFWDGRETDLDRVVLQPFTNPREMGLRDLGRMRQAVAAQPRYAARFAAAFGDAGIDDGRIAQALAAYLRSLPTGASRYDLHRQRRGRLTQDELSGLALFEGKAACADCHTLSGDPVAFTDNRFHHTGVGFERVAGNVNRMLARLDALKAQGRPLGVAILDDADIAELGRFAVTRKPEDLGAFRTPSLRNVATTAPYMHDGSIATLQDAVEREIYYRSLARGRPIALTIDEQRQLIAFLNALTITGPEPGP